MKKLRVAQALMALAMIGAMVAVTVQQIFAAPRFADEAFARVWNREDRAVVEGVSQFGRSWTWGPENLTEGMRETYKDSRDGTGTRLVQYFDKSRMEINDPAGNPNDRFFVTNGLLPIELMTGQLQTGLASFETRSRATISAVGDPDNIFPTYADMSVLYNRTPETDAEGAPVTRQFTPDGVKQGFTKYAADPRTFLGGAQNGYRIPQAFINFQNLQDFVFENNQYRFGPLFDPLFVFGLPVTDAFWVRSKVGGKEQDVLVQVFERRVLTYSPEETNPAFQVAMGNVGRHYYEWRYGRAPGTTATPVPATPVPPTDTPQPGTTATAVPVNPTATPTTQPYPNP